jgi:hypothetical protein
MKSRFTEWLFRRLLNATVVKRAPDVVIGGADRPYMLRWHVVPRNRFFNVYFHHFRRSDDDRALHDHPWWNFSYLLDGEYVEVTIPAGGVHKRQRFEAGDFKFRYASYAHRVELTDGPCWTLFVTGPRIRQWGFHCPNGWRHWKTFTKTNNPGEVGMGCGES